MPQLDKFIFLDQVLLFTIIFFIFYNYNVKYLLPIVSKTLKVREKFFNFFVNLLHEIKVDWLSCVFFFRYKGMENYICILVFFESLFESLRFFSDIKNYLKIFLSLSVLNSRCILERLGSNVLFEYFFFCLDGRIKGSCSLVCSERVLSTLFWLNRVFVKKVLF